MKIKCKDDRLVAQAVCFARALNIFAFDLEIRVEGEVSYCEQKENGSFLIIIQKGLDKHWRGQYLAHEMVHLRQYKRDELTYIDGVRHWKGEYYPYMEFLTDDYWLSPWEMEARALEGWLMHKWRHRKSELQ